MGRGKGGQSSISTAIRLTNRQILEERFDKERETLRAVAMGSLYLQNSLQMIFGISREYSSTVNFEINTGTVEILNSDFFAKLTSEVESSNEKAAKNILKDSMDSYAKMFETAIGRNLSQEEKSVMSSVYHESIGVAMLDWFLDSSRYRKTDDLQGINDYVKTRDGLTESGINFIPACLQAYRTHNPDYLSSVYRLIKEI